MRATNWLGQVIRVGTVVARGARDGNTSSFKVGRVVNLNLEKRIARVEWLREMQTYGHRGDRYAANKDEHGNLVGFPGGVGWNLAGKSYGSPGIDTLFVIDPETFNFDLGGLECL